ncbi:MAG: lysylphosphatidylglycerol synthase domain-containing protein [candidate division WOR-3 bacterium]
MNWKAVWKWTRPFLAAAVVFLISYYLYQQIVSGWDELSGRLSFSPGICVGFLLLSAPPLLGPLIWWGIVRQLRGKMSPREAYWAWSAANLGKYMPGKVWNIAGRFYFSRDSKLIIAESILIEVMANLWAAFLAAATAIPFGLWASGIAWLMAAGAALGLLGLAWPRLLQKAVRLPLKLLRREVPPSQAFSRKAYLLTTLWLYLIWLVGGLGIWLVLRDLGYQSNPLTAGGANALSWMVGYLFLLVPGGFGVREGTFSWLMSGTAATALAAVFTRLAITVWEIIGFLVGVCLRPGEKKR